MTADTIPPAAAVPPIPPVAQAMAAGPVTRKDIARQLNAAGMSNHPIAAVLQATADAAMSGGEGSSLSP